MAPPKKQFRPAYPNGQTTLDQFYKVWVCPFCGKVYSHPSSLSFHKPKCDKVPPEVRQQWRREVIENKLRLLDKTSKLLNEKLDRLETLMKELAREEAEKFAKKYKYIS